MAASDATSNDQKIINLLAQDDRKSISLIYQYHANALFHNIRKVVSIDEDAEDIVQELIISIWEKRKTLKLVAPVRNYLLIAAYNRALNYLNQKEGSVGRIIRLHIENLDQLASPKDRPDRRDLHKEIHKAVLKIPGKTGTVFLLSAVFDMSNQEIADHFGVTLKAVEKHITKARRLLKVLLAHLQIALILIDFSKYFVMEVGLETILLY